MSAIVEPSFVVHLGARAIGIVHVFACSYRDRVRIREICSWVLFRACGVPSDRAGELLACTGGAVRIAAKRVDKRIADGTEEDLVALIGLLAECDDADVRLPERQPGGRRREDGTQWRDGALLLPTVKHERALIRLRIVEHETPILQRPVTTRVVPVVRKSAHRRLGGSRLACPSARPCPHVNCRHHLPTSCVLDVVALGPQTESEIADLMGECRNTINTISVTATRKLHAQAQHEGSESSELLAWMARLGDSQPGAR